MCLPLLLCAFFFGCLGLLRICSFPPSSVPALVLPASVGPLGLSGPVSFLLSFRPGFWLYLATARLSCLVVWSVMTARVLSSPVLMATKASALCGALPSTPCCGCCSGAFICLQVIRNPLWTPLELHAPTSSARAAFSPLLRSLAPSPSSCCWPPLAFSLVPVHTKAIMAQLSLYLVCFSCVLLVCLVFFGLYSCFVAVPVGSQLRTKDCRVLPAPSVHTNLLR